MGEENIAKAMKIIIAIIITIANNIIQPINTTAKAIN